MTGARCCADVEFIAVAMATLSAPLVSTSNVAKVAATTVLVSRVLRETGVAGFLLLLLFFGGLPSTLGTTNVSVLACCSLRTAAITVVDTLKMQCSDWPTTPPPPRNGVLQTQK